MRDDSGETISPWWAMDETPRFSPLATDARAEVCIVGAGIAGLTTAYMLAREGVSVHIKVRDSGRGIPTDKFGEIFEKFKRLDMTPFNWPIDELAAPALILIGDSDGTRLEHAVEMFRRLGGGVFGDMISELPASQMAILPGTTHVGMLERVDWISSMVTTFLDRSSTVT